MEKSITKLVYIAAAIAAVWLFVRCLLPWTAPLIVAFAMAALMEAPVKFLMRYRWKRGAAAAVITLAVLGVIVFLTAKLASLGIQTAANFAKDVPQLMENVSRLAESVSGRVERFASSAPESVREYIAAAVESFGKVIYTLPELVSRKALDILTKAAAGSPTIFLFLVTAGIGTYFFSASFPETPAFIGAQLPRQTVERLLSVRENLKKSFGGFMKAQLILMAMTFFQLVIAFMLLKIRDAV